LDLKTLLLKAMGAAGLTIDFLFHWMNTGDPLELIVEGQDSPTLLLRILGFSAHALFIIAFLAMIILPLRIRRRTV